MNSPYGFNPFPQQRYQGRREGNQDYFDGALPQEVSGSTLGGSEAMQELFTPRMDIRPEGLEIAFTCTACGKTLGPVIEWSELLFLSFGLNPFDPAQTGFLDSRKRSTVRTSWRQLPDRTWEPYLHNCSERGLTSGIAIKSGEARNALLQGINANLIANDPTFYQNLVLFNQIRMAQHLPQFDVNRLRLALAQGQG